MHKLKFLVLAAASVLVCAPAYADERIALLIGTSSTAARASIGNQILRLADRLEEAGFTVIRAQDPTPAETELVLSRFAQRVEGAERALILASGRFATTGRATWLVPPGADTTSVAGLVSRGISVDLLLDLAARVPGGAVVGLDASSRMVSSNAGVRSGLGRDGLRIPQGVTVITGAPGQVADFMLDELMRPGAVLADRRRLTRRSVRISGYLGQGAFLPAAPASRRDREEIYWDVVTDIGTLDAMIAYLDAYPDGRFAVQATARIVELRTASERVARDEEAALSLTRAERQDVQRDLTLLGFDTRGIDGIFGRGTRSALSAWQTDNGYPPTGFLTRQQLTAMRAAAKAEGERAAEEEQRQDASFWRQIGRGSDESGLRAYLRRYPDGLYADVAKERLAAIEADRRDQLEAVERDVWDQTQSADSIEGYRSYLQTYPRGLFADEARARVQALEQADQNPAVIEKARAEENQLGLPAVTFLLVEQRLNALGLQPGPVDGRLTDESREAIRKYQRSRDLPVTGYLSRGTVVRLVSEAAR
ncbi:MAG: peptidoglycan-binding protein [Pseudomonadota bacterium]